MSNVRHVHGPLMVVDAVDDSIVSDADPPEPSPPSELSNSPRPRGVREPLKSLEDSFLRRSGQILKVPLGGACQDDPILKHADVGVFSGAS